MTGKANNGSFNAYREILDCIPQPYIIINGNKKIVTFNRKADDEIRGLDLPELKINKNIDDYFCDLLEFNSVYSSCLSKGSAFFSGCFKENRGKENVKDFSLYLCKGKDIPRDMVVINWLYKEQSAINESQEGERKDKILSIIAHDLINPISGIMGFSELMIKEITSYSQAMKEIKERLAESKSKPGKYEREELLRIDSMMRHAGIINNSTKEVFSLLENLLDWTRSKDRYVSEFENVNVRDAVADIVSFNKIPAEIKNITINRNIGAAYKVLADKNMLKTILRNLISNAVKFTPRNGIIDVTADYTNIHAHEKSASGKRTGEKYVRINVSDNGVGIPESRLKTLLTSDEVFTTKGTDSEKGTGLGLLVCREFSAKMDGYITVKSKRGVGSIFSVSLPSAV
ncbi:MAG TPA: PAS domain-containing sensor histidine kinase [Ignavibacteria bacterium]|nr:PAS domain-containing sensor histidine kinase [Ignavibacteria bacterium]